MEGLETDARAAKKGLWADPQPVPPWEGGSEKESDEALTSAFRVVTHTKHAVEKFSEAV